MAALREMDMQVLVAGIRSQLGVEEDSRTQIPSTSPPLQPFEPQLESEAVPGPVVLATAAPCYALTAAESHCPPDRVTEVRASIDIMSGERERGRERESGREGDGERECEGGSERECV